MSTELEANHALAVLPQRSTEISVDVVLDRLSKIQDLMRRAMVIGIDYGQIPGTGSKPTLLKPGAEKLCLMFRFAPRYVTKKTFHEDAHLTVESTCQVLDFDGHFMGEASAICSTRESKYAYRKAERTCPICGVAAIIKGKAEYGGGYICWAKKSGCGAKFDDDEPLIVKQNVGQVDNEQLPDQYNTVLRIAEKRAYLGAVRLVTGCSSLFDEEIPAVNESDPQPPVEKPTPAPAKPAPPARGVIGKDQAGEIIMLLKKYKLTEREFCEFYHIKAIAMLPAAKWIEACDKIHEVGNAGDA